ncbi:N-acetylmuramoyl-L-alanine amidase [Tatumella ptyseos]|uniref:N-acetylmuramoyl-L-alanine amidase n=1 Tax=Tatumella ptyseos TaxID=82987 RepID=UPI0026F15D38|nr:N-acetylmuramoyl-L-alanine amidase [Tatumella ptyseos]WKX27562.1 N-acetylmuramoyl-L-alanine amidase [Tatumella ptyseos]
MKKGFLITLALLSGCQSTMPPTSVTQQTINTTYVASSHQPRINTIVIHYTVADEQRSLTLLTGKQVSSHYLIAQNAKANQRSPEIYQLVPENQAAWHAGMSAWRDTINLNKTSIGIELVNRGFTQSAGQQFGHCESYPPQQIAVLTNLVRDIANRYKIEPENIIGHSDIAPLRKVDPGPCFPWQQLAEKGIGAWPDSQLVTKLLAGRDATTPVANSLLLPLLKQYGYAISAHATPEEQQQFIRAFQMHFQPENSSGVGDQLTLARLQALLLQYPWHR